MLYKIAVFLDIALVTLDLQLGETEEFDDRRKIRARLREIREKRTGEGDFVISEVGRNKARGSWS